MFVHADILRMAKTEERRDLMRWFAARSIFFASVDEEALADGLALVQQCRHEDARFLVSLFPHGPPKNLREAADVFLAQQSDARCLCWAARFCGQAEGENAEGELLRRSAERGNAWGQYSFYLWGAGKKRDLESVQRAADQGEPEALATLGSHYWHGMHMAADKERAKLLWREAALLGHGWAQFYYAEECRDNPVERFVWLRRLAVSGFKVAQNELLSVVSEELTRFDQGCSGRVLFEIGAAFSGISNWSGQSKVAGYANRAVNLHDQWCASARRAVLCWLWLARDRNIVRDIRLLIADLIWQERAAWSEMEDAK